MKVFHFFLNMKTKNGIAHMMSNTHKIDALEKVIRESKGKDLKLAHHEVEFFINILKKNGIEEIEDFSKIFNRNGLNKNMIIKLMIFLINNYNLKNISWRTLDKTNKIHRNFFFSAMFIKTDIIKKIEEFVNSYIGSNNVQKQFFIQIQELIDKISKQCKNNDENAEQESLNNKNEENAEQESLNNKNDENAEHESLNNKNDENAKYEMEINESEGNKENSSFLFFNQIPSDFYDDCGENDQLIIEYN